MPNSTKRSLRLILLFVVLLIAALNTYISANSQFLQEVLATYTNAKAGPKVSDNFKVLDMSKLLPLKTAFIEISDDSLQLGKGEFTRKEIEETITSALDIKAADTKYGAPQIHLSYKKRSAAPFCAGTFVWTKLTLTAPQQVDANGKESPVNIVYSSERGGIYTDKEKESSLNAIDKSLGRLKGLMGSLETGQRGLNLQENGKLYEAPSKTLDGRQAPVQNQPAKEK